MQTLKDDIRERILKVAHEQFSQKGYLKTSMRDIAVLADVGVGNIYNYFPNKDEIFRMVLRPVILQFEAMLQNHHGNTGSDAMKMITEDYFQTATNEYVSLIRNHRGLMKMLLFQAQGSSLENFRERFTDRATILVKGWFAENKQKYPEINAHVSDFFIHLHTVWMFSLFEEILMHDIDLKQMEQIVEEYLRFEIHGWRYLMKI